MNKSIEELVEETCRLVRLSDYDGLKAFLTKLIVTPPQGPSDICDELSR